MTKSVFFCRELVLELSKNSLFRHSAFRVRNTKLEIIFVLHNFNATFYRQNETLAKHIGLDLKTGEGQSRVVEYSSPVRDVFRVSLVHSLWFAVKPVIQVTLEEICVSIAPSEYRVNVIRNASPEVREGSGVAFVCT